MARNGLDRAVAEVVAEASAEAWVAGGTAEPGAETEAVSFFAAEPSPEEDEEEELEEEELEGDFEEFDFR